MSAYFSDASLKFLRGLARQQRMQEFHLRQAQRRQAAVAGFDGIYHAVQHHYPGHDGLPGEMPGQCRVVNRNGEMHRAASWQSLPGKDTGAPA